MSRIRITLLTLICTTLLLCSSSAQARGYTFDIIDLGTVGNDTASYASSINNSGMVVGTSVDTNGDTQGFLWTEYWPSNGTMLGLKKGSHDTYATAIDSSGTILGGAVKNNKTESGLWHSWNPNGNMSKLNHMTMAYNINDNGQILASNGDASQTYIYSIWGGHNPIKVGGDMSIKYASDINTSGNVIGETELGTPYIWNMYNNSTELISSIQGSATDINRSNEVVGTKTGDVATDGTVIDTGESQAYVYRNGEVVELGYVGVGTTSEAYAINEEGLIVGTSNGNAFLWSEEGGMLNLNDLLPDSSEWSNLSVASDINDLGQIVGWGTINGQTHSFIISNIASAPEPKIIFIAFLSIGIILFRAIQGIGSKS